MFNLRSIKWAYALIIVTGVASADVLIDGQIIPNADISGVVSVNPATGRVIITTTTGYTVTKDVVGDNVTISGFSASPTVIAVGESTTLNWSTQNADACTGSGGFGTWPGTLGVNGPKTVTASTADSYVFTLTCSGAVGGPVTQSRTVTVTTEPEPNNCGVPSLSTKTIIDWAAQFGYAFPEPKYSNQVVTIPRTGYYGVQLTTPGVVTQGSLVTIEETSTSGRRLGALSKCQGDFNVLDECKYTWGTGGGILWTTDPNDTTGRCLLDQDTQYYWNVTFTDGVNADSSECGSVPCTTKLRVIHK